MPSLESKSYSANITLMYLDSTDFSRIAAVLEEKLAHAPPDFFTAMPIVADCSRINEGEMRNLAQLKQVFNQHKLSLVGISGTSLEEAEIAAQGLAKFEINDIRAAAKPQSNAEKSPKPQTIAAALPPSAAAIAPPLAAQNKILRGNVRSGQRVYAQGGDLTVIGTVGAGAEVIADGNVYILGSLRGRAFAGAQGNDEAHIFANDFDAEIVSIAGSYQNFEQLDPYRGGKNCLVTLNKDETMLIVSL